MNKTIKITCFSIIIIIIIIIKQITVKYMLVQ